eukprot:scaffold1880_cov115-Isochrysis_galbana.AAC.8
MTLLSSLHIGEVDCVAASVGGWKPAGAPHIATAYDIDSRIAGSDRSMGTGSTAAITAAAAELPDSATYRSRVLGLRRHGARALAQVEHRTRDVGPSLRIQGQGPREACPQPRLRSSAPARVPDGLAARMQHQRKLHIAHYVRHIGARRAGVARDAHAAARCHRAISRDLARGCRDDNLGHRDEAVRRLACGLRQMGAGRVVQAEQQRAKLISLDGGQAAQASHHLGCAWSSRLDGRPFNHAALRRAGRRRRPGPRCSLERAACSATRARTAPSRLGSTRAAKTRKRGTEMARHKRRQWRRQHPVSHP